MIPDSVFTLERAKAHLRVLHDHEDALITSLLDAAVSRAEQYTGRAWTERTVAMRFIPDGKCYTRKFYPAPLWPIDEVTTFGYIDANGDPQAMPADSYTVTPGGITVTRWPDDAMVTRAERAVATYRAIPLMPEIPADVVAAVMLYLGDMYANREAGIVGSIYTENMTARAMLWAHKQDLIA
jgi:uncharacterized phiE125 gp8 family phage protein